MRRMVLAILSGALVWVAPGCAPGSGTLMIDFNGKTIEVRQASEVRLPKGNESLFQPSEWKMRVAGQEPITVVCGGVEQVVYTTDTTIQINGRAIDLGAGERVIISPDGYELPTGQIPAPAPTDDGGGDGDGTGDGG